MHLSTSAQIIPISTRITQTQMSMNTHIPTHCLFTTHDEILGLAFFSPLLWFEATSLFLCFFFHNRICQHLRNFWSSLFCCFPISFLLILFLSVLKHLATTLPPGTELQLPVCCRNSFKENFSFTCMDRSNDNKECPLPHTGRNGRVIFQLSSF